MTISVHFLAKPVVVAFKNLLPRKYVIIPWEATHETVNFWYFQVPVHFLTTLNIVYELGPCRWQIVLRGLCVVFNTEEIEYRSLSLTQIVRVDYFNELREAGVLIVLPLQGHVVLQL